MISCRDIQITVKTTIEYESTINVKMECPNRTFKYMVWDQLIIRGYDEKFLCF